jgi:hypothetical protein
LPFRQFSKRQIYDSTAAQREDGVQNTLPMRELHRFGLPINRPGVDCHASPIGVLVVQIGPHFSAPNPGRPDCLDEQIGLTGYVFSTPQLSLSSQRRFNPVGAQRLKALDKLNCLQGERPNTACHRNLRDRSFSYGALWEGNQATPLALRPRVVMSERRIAFKTRPPLCGLQGKLKFDGTNLRLSLCSRTKTKEDRILRFACTTANRSGQLKPASPLSKPTFARQERWISQRFKRFGAEGMCTNHAPYTKTTQVIIYCTL